MGKACQSTWHLRAALWDAACFATTYALLRCIILVKLTKSNSFKRNIQNTAALKCRTAFLIRAVPRKVSLLAERLQPGTWSRKPSCTPCNTSSGGKKILLGEKNHTFLGKKRMLANPFWVPQSWINCFCCCHRLILLGNPSPSSLRSFLSNPAGNPHQPLGARCKGCLLYL